MPLTLAALTACCLVPSMAIGEARSWWDGPPPGAPRVVTCYDLLEHFAEAVTTNALQASVNPHARTHAIIKPAINLHPVERGDSILTYPAVPLPVVGDGEKLLLLVWIAMSDGVPWEGERKPNGVRFGVGVEGAARFSEDIAAPGWRPRAVDLTRWAGRTVALDLRTNAIDGHVAYDWALFGQPRVVRFRGVGDPAALAGAGPGVALAEARSREAGQAVATVGQSATPVELRRGRGLLAVPFTAPGLLRLDVTSGAAEMREVLYAPWEFSVRAESLALASPLVTVGREFTMLLGLRNDGPGRCPGGEKLTLELQGPGDPRPRLLSTTLPPVEAAGEAVARWPGLRLSRPGRALARVRHGDDERVLAFDVLPPESPATVSHIVGNDHARLTFHLPDTGPGWAVAETRNGSRWQRLGTLYPLARVVVAEGGAQREMVPHLALTDAAGDELVMESRPEADGLTVRLGCRVVPETPRLLLKWELQAAKPADLLAFSGPTFLAGDRAFGVRKDFALFPGVEHLEGDEPSSSARDLAPPLDDRRTPAPYRIASPLMAVQGEGGLAALLWDMGQEWAPAETCPAARFIAPDRASGRDCVEMSLFAPSVGRYVDENQAQAARPYAIPAGGAVRLTATLVLDHASRWGDDRVVNGQHRGGLVLKAMQHWYDTFGLPEPSSPPRPWEEQRALGREAFLRTLWSEDPAGWPPFLGQPVGDDTESFAPLMLEMQAGLDEATRRELQARMDQVAARVLPKAGPAALLQGNRVLLPFHYGYLGETLVSYRAFARSLLGGRENGLWVWWPGDAEHARLGVPGSHTLGQAAYPALVVMRAARFTGDPALIREGLAAMRQMERYEVPRGASMWECPQYQPDLLAAALAIKAYCEAYQLTGDERHLDHARYWAWTGLPFIYTWGLPGYPTMRGNSVGVIGSTFFTHSWVGRPVVWMGLDYAYALQDLAEHDDGFPWSRVAQSITTSALWQQYAEGPSKGLMPDSWELSANHANPADILPSLILLNEHRLRGLSLEVRHARLRGREGAVMVNSSADIVSAEGGPASGEATLRLSGPADATARTAIAPVPEPRAVAGAGDRAADGQELAARVVGWQYVPELGAVILQQRLAGGAATATLRW